MSQAYTGEIRMMAFPFAPKFWAVCNGQLLPINQNQALFSILGTTYGGDGVTTFALPNLQGRAPIHWGSGPGLPVVTVGQTGGEVSHPLTAAETAAHTHGLNAATAPAANALGANNAFLGKTTPNVYASGSPSAALAASSVAANAGGQPHSNMQPYQVVNFCICVFGVFPSRN